MKFILILWVCSFMAGSNCYQPMKFPMMYDSWYECSREAHKQSIRVLSTIGFKQVNDLQLGTKYHCQKVRTYWHCGRIVVNEFSLSKPILRFFVENRSFTIPTTYLHIRIIQNPTLIGPWSVVRGYFFKNLVTLTKTVGISSFVCLKRDDCACGEYDEYFHIF